MTLILALAQKLQAVLQVDVVRLVDQPLVRRTRRLLRRDILVQIDDRIALRLYVGRRPRHACSIVVKYSALSWLL